MRDKVFVDTNIFVYSIGDDLSRKRVASEILTTNNNIIISSQVVGEFVSVCTRKLKIPIKEAVFLANNFMQVLHVHPITKTVLSKSFGIMEKYGFSIWDSMIVATALEANCKILYSEDMQSGQKIEGVMLIVNPFI